MASRIGWLGIAAAAGLGLAFAAPRSWGVAPFHGILLGAAVYIAALRHPTATMPRVAAFVALAAAQAWVLFVAAPGADLRATFVILSTWVAVESVGARSAASRSV